MDKLRLEVILAAVDKVTGPLKAVATGSKETAQALGKTQAALKNLQAQQRALARFEQERDRLDNARSMLEQAKATNVNRVAVKQLTADYEKQLSVVKKLQADMAGRGWGDATVDQKQLASSIKNTNAQIDAQRKKLELQQGVEQRLANLRARHAKAMMHTGMMAGASVAMQAAGRKGVDLGLGPVRSYSSHEDAMLGIARQVPGARDEMGNLTEVYRQAEKDVRSLSGEIPLATTEIAAMMTAAARMEVPTAELREFTLLASQMAIAFDAVPDEVTESMGKVAKNFKIPLTNIRGLADSINYLDDNAISKGADIIDFLNRTSGVVSTVAMSAKDAAALGSTLLTLGERTETAATAANAIVQKFAAATKGTKKFRSALDEIGLSAEAVQMGMSKDATGTLDQVIAAIGKLPEDKRIGVMVELVGMEHSDTLAKLVDKPEELARQRALANGSGAGGSMAREAAARNAALSAQWQKTKNRLFNLSAAAGESLVPAITSLLTAVNPLIERFTAWVQQNPEIVGGVLKVVVAGSALLVLLGGLGIALAAFKGAFHIGGFLLSRWLLNLVATRTAAAGATPVLGMLGRVWSWVSGLLARAGPWILRAGQWLGGLATTVGGRLLPLVMRLAPVFLRFGLILLRLVTGPIGLLILAGTMLYERWDGVVGGFKLLMQDIGDAVVGAAQFVWSLGTKFFEAGANIVQGMADGITSRISAVRDAVSMMAGDSIDWFKEKLDINSPSRVFMRLGGYVGEGVALGIEKGSGMVRHAALGMASAAVVPMAAMAATPVSGPAGLGAAATGGSSYQITINAAPGMDAQAIARAVAAELDRREKAASSRRYSQLADID